VDTARTRPVTHKGPVNRGDDGLMAGDTDLVTPPSPTQGTHRGVKYKASALR